jgi:branched-chain amino acid transport system substrate-binding protein
VRLARWLLTIAALACVAGCGGGETGGGKIRGRTLTIYFSGPSQGASSAGASAALHGASLALAEVQGRMGRYRIVLRSLDDSTPQSGRWDPNQTTNDARIAAQDPTTIGYLGDFNSGATAISIPVLNRAGIAQVGPAASGVGLTSAGPGASPGEPEKYYPTGTRTFARPVPSDATQALVQVQLAQARGCQRMFVLHDGEVDGEDEALTFVLTAQSVGLRVVGIQAFPLLAPDYSPLALSVARSGADCVLLSAIDEPSSARLTQQLARALPHAPIIVSAPLAESTYTDPADGGIPFSIDSRVLITSPTLGPAAYPPSAQAFLAEYSRRFGPPEPQAIFGYEAMSLLLSAIRTATDHGRRTAQRSRVVHELLATRDRRSVIGTYSINREGDTTLRRYGVYQVLDGQLSFVRQSG